MEFITKKRQKVKLGPFIHHPIPEIEAYANQLEWVEGTLVDQDSTRIYIKNALIDLEKQLGGFFPAGARAVRHARTVRQAREIK